MTSEKVKKTSTVRVGNVLQSYWRAMEPQAWAFYLTSGVFLVSHILRVLPPLFYKRFFDIISVAPAGEQSSVAPELIGVLVLILSIQGVSWALFQGALFVLQDFESRVMARMKQISFDYLIEHSYAFFSNTFTGALVQRVNRFSRSFEQIYDTYIFNLIPLIVQTIGAVTVVWFQEPAIAFIIVGWVLFIITFSYYFSHWKLAYDIRSTEADSATTARLADTVTNQNAVSLFVGTEYESDGFKKVSDDQAAAQRKTWNLSMILDGTQAGLIVLVEFFVFFYAVRFWEQGLVTIGTFVLIQVYVINIAGQLWGFSRVIRNLYQGFADAKEMVEILALPHEVRDSLVAHPLEVLGGDVRFDKVSFAFNETRTVLNHITLSVKGGEKVALIGPSGAGKSTIVKLLLRMYDVTEGRIFIDEQNIQEVTQESLRTNVSLVPQDPVLFHRTLLENIRYGRRDATDEEVKKAAQLAHCDEFIDGLPDKYNTYVGERGIKLSGGERQRVAIARAILKNAPILILDEATSSLDSHSESLIQDALDKLMEGKTTIVIAHRLSTIRKMDRIVVLNEGKIVEEGSHDELVARSSSLYKDLWKLQAGGFLPQSKQEKKTDH